MAISVITVLTQAKPAGVNILAQDANGRTAMENSIAAATGDLMSASEVGGKPVDVVIPAAVAPATDGTPKAVFRVEFRVGSGPNGTTPTSLVVLAWPQTNGTVTAAAAILAAQAAATTAGAVVSQVSLLAQVDVDATNATPVAGPLTKFQFRCLFTLDELVAVDNYQTNASLSESDKAMVNTILANFAAAEDIDLAAPATIQGVNYLGSIDLIPPGRVPQILGNVAPVSAIFPSITAEVATAIVPVNIVASNGSGSGYTFTMGTGVPDGMTISVAGQISGTPTTAGTYNYTARVTDSSGGTIVGGGTITVTAN